MSKNEDGDRVHLGGGAVYDKDLLGGSASKRSAGYVASIEAGNDVDEDEDEMDTGAMPQLGIRQVMKFAKLQQNTVEVGFMHLSRSTRRRLC